MMLPSSFNIFEIHNRFRNINLNPVVRLEDILKKTNKTLSPKSKRRKVDADTESEIKKEVLIGIGNAQVGECVSEQDETESSAEELRKCSRHDEATCIENVTPPENHDKSSMIIPPVAESVALHCDDGNSAPTSNDLDTSESRIIKIKTEPIEQQEEETLVNLESSEFSLFIKNKKHN